MTNTAIVLNPALESRSRRRPPTLRALRLILSAVALLTLATSASAECAWVVWIQQSVGPIDTTAEPPWLVVEAAPTYAACESAKAEKLKHAARPQANVVTALFENSVSVTIRDAEGRSVTWLIRIQCFPDTVDPRGPKGK